MNTEIITELIEIKLLDSTKRDELLLKANEINTFLQNEDGFIRAELIKNIESNVWYFVYHFENFEKLKAVGVKLRSNKMFEGIKLLIVPDSMNVSFYEQIEKW